MPLGEGASSEEADGTTKRSLPRTTITPALIALWVLACGLSFGARYFYFFRYSDPVDDARQIGGDPENFLKIAYSISQTGYFAVPTNVDVKESLLGHEHPPLAAPEGVRRTAWRPPLWPFVLACMMRLANYDLRRMLYLRFVFDLVTLLLFYRLLLHLNLHGVSRMVALLLFAVHPAWLLYSGTFFSEPLTLLVHVAFSLSVLALLRDSRSLIRAGVAGVLAGLTVLEHPFYLFFPFFITAFIYAAKLVRVRSALLLLAGMAVTMTPWVLRNMLLYHTAKPIITTSAGINFAKGWNPAFLNLYRDTTADVVINETVLGTENIKTSNLNEEEQSEAYTRLALNYAKTNWRLIPAIAARKLAGALDPIPETPRGGILEIGRTLFQVVSFLPLFLVLASRRAGQFRLLSASLLLAYAAMSVLTLGTIRYRFPLIWVELLSVIFIIEIVARRFGDSFRRQPRGASSRPPLSTRVKFRWDCASTSKSEAPTINLTTLKGNKKKVVIYLMQCR